MEFNRSFMRHEAWNVSSPLLFETEMHHKMNTLPWEFHATLQVMSKSKQRWYYNDANGTDDDYAGLAPADDVSIGGVLTAFIFNLVIGIMMMLTYEVLRRYIPSVYGGRRRHMASMNSDRMMSSLPTVGVPLNWVGPVFGVPWSRVRQAAGLDAYMFLRYIRMCLRVTSVSAFWGLLILSPIYATGENGAEGWYYFSMANVSQYSWRLWVPVFFLYLFSFFVFFVMKQEYRHFLELRMEFLGKGEANVHPQHQYSLKVERIPYELRSSTALFDYFNSLFPGKVHSASIVMQVPGLEKLSTRRRRVTHRLEKSIAYYHATGKRPTHVVGRGRLKYCGIELSPWTWRPCFPECGRFHAQDDGTVPEKGDQVDSILYYTRDLADCNAQMVIFQNQVNQLAEIGNQSFRATTWLEKAVDALSCGAMDILDESMIDNGLTTPKQTSASSRRLTAGTTGVTQVERMKSVGARYGSFSEAAREPVPTNNEQEEDLSDLPWQYNAPASASVSARGIEQKKARLINEDHLLAQESGSSLEEKSQERSIFKRIAGRLGLDFAMTGVTMLRRHLDVVVDNVANRTTSSTGFVTFLDLASVTCASSAPLTHKPNILDVSIAPEPRDIQWDNTHIDKKLGDARELTVNILLGLGAILWSFPLTAIQALATAENVARIPGMDWIETFDGGNLYGFINGYLPVMALLTLILVLPFIFTWIASKYERRKTFSDIQESILGRYFYYQLANIYITVTAGSLWKSLADILDHPSNVLEILGRSLPTVVGYFIALLSTKILAGLPMVILRFGALGRMLFLKTFFREAKLTQQELDEVYRPEQLLYGWEYPTQLLVIVICFTYACISPLILPVGALYFLGALMVYKKQALYVYTPTYESGGLLFSSACDRTLFGLVCGQITFIGYTAIRQGYYQQLFLLPLPFLTVWVMGYFRRTYAEPAKRLSLERAMELDRISDLRAAVSHAVSASTDTAVDETTVASSQQAGAGVARLKAEFDEDAYWQPVLTEGSVVPLPYRQEAEEDLMSQEAVQAVRSAHPSDRYAPTANMTATASAHSTTTTKTIHVGAGIPRSSSSTAFV
eukprot:CAMPEP_0198291930 /NCGR_PEP_ID=MMETSP1449-20131203/9268_1 /TAXON_ID=420275 /ORGANISM="Attheya septentrionalis, Strain CCMP2084" /LENGTH=1076 /DNA_ID=CAMNT_0043990617 /DNA_START=67 /DNA_END=3297 /DNA_ORIENTATION=-